MDSLSDLLSFERFDTLLELNELQQNFRELLAKLVELERPFSRDVLLPTFAYFAETETIIATKSRSMQILVAQCIIEYIKLTYPEIPFDNPTMMVRVLHLFSLVFRNLSDIDSEHYEPSYNVLKGFNEMEVFVLVNDSTSQTEIFNALVDIQLPEAVEVIVNLITKLERFNAGIYQTLVDHLDKKHVREVLTKLPDPKQAEFLQSIFSTTSGVELVKTYSKVLEFMENQSVVIINSLRGELLSEDDPLREGVVELFIQILADTPLEAETRPLFTSVMQRQHDKLSSIRGMVVDFSFDLLKKEGFEGFHDDIWELVAGRVTDISVDVRTRVMKGISTVPIEDVNLSMKDLSLRLKDKAPKVRKMALNTLLAAYEKDKRTMKWLEQMVISLYSEYGLKEIALIGFEKFMERQKLIPFIMKQQDKTAVLGIVRDVYTFCRLLPDRVISQISPYIDEGLLKKYLHKIPKSFFAKALKKNQRKAQKKTIKSKTSNDFAGILFAYYQPLRFSVSDLLACKDSSVVKSLAEFCANDFIDQIDLIIGDINENGLLILSRMKEVEIDDEQRTMVLTELLPHMAGSKSAQKAFARLFTPSNSQLLKQVRFTSSQLEQKGKFYAELGQSNLVPKRLVNDLIKAEHYRIALRIISLDPTEETINEHVKLLDSAPADVLSSYLRLNPTCYQYQTPEVFRTFASLVQHENCELRRRAICIIRDALLAPGAPIQYLAALALSATDPHKSNATEAKKAIDCVVMHRRELVKQIGPQHHIMPESSLPYLIYLLAHHEDLEKDDIEYTTFTTYLRFFLVGICTGTSDYDGILDLLFHIKLSEDHDEDYTPKLSILCDIAMQIVKEIGGGRKWSLNNSVDIELPSRYFKPTTDIDRLKRELINDHSSTLMSPLLPSPKRVLSAGMSPALPSKTRHSTRTTVPEKEKTSPRKRSVKKGAESARQSPIRKGAGTKSVVPKVRKPPQTPQVKISRRRKTKVADVSTVIPTPLD